MACPIGKAPGSAAVMVSTQLATSSAALCPQATQVPSLLQAAPEHQRPHQEQVGFERPPWQCLPGAAPPHGQFGLRKPVGDGHPAALKAWPQPLYLFPVRPLAMSHCPAATLEEAALAHWPLPQPRTLRPPLSGTGCPALPTPASWGSETSPGAASVIYKANFIKFVTSPWFPCWDGRPVAA